MSMTGRVLTLLSSVVIGVFIMLSPGFITGHTFNASHYSGSLYTAEFIVRSAAVIIGLLIIYDGIRSSLKSQSGKKD